MLAQHNPQYHPLPLLLMKTCKHRTRRFPRCPLSIPLLTREGLELSHPTRIPNTHISRWVNVTSAA